MYPVHSAPTPAPGRMVFLTGLHPRLPQPRPVIGNSP
jgi:hypothetical protein